MKDTFPIEDTQPDRSTAERFRRLVMALGAPKWSRYRCVTPEREMLDRFNGELDTDSLLALARNVTAPSCKLSAIAMLDEEQKAIVEAWDSAFAAATGEAGVASISGEDLSLKLVRKLKEALSK